MSIRLGMSITGPGEELWVDAFRGGQVDRGKATLVEKRPLPFNSCLNLEALHTGLELDLLVWVCLSGPLNPASSLSSPFCGQRICLRMMARIIIPNTKHQTAIRRGVMTQPIIWMPRDSKALPMANVAVMSAVLGNTYEYHVMLKVILSLPTQDQCAPTDTMKNHSAILLISCHHLIRSQVELAHPQIHRLIQVATTFSMVDTTRSSPMKSFGIAR